jgi:hypothetical protein
MTEKQITYIETEGSGERGWVAATYRLPYKEDGKGNFPAGAMGDIIPVLLRKCHITPQRRVGGKYVCDILLDCGVVAEVYRRDVREAE